MPAGHDRLGSLYELRQLLARQRRECGGFWSSAAARSPSTALAAKAAPCGNPPQRSAGAKAAEPEPDVARWMAPANLPGETDAQDRILGAREQRGLGRIWGRGADHGGRGNGAPASGAAATSADGERSGVADGSTRRVATLAAVGGVCAGGRDGQHRNAVDDSAELGGARGGVRGINAVRRGDADSTAVGGDGGRRSDEHGAVVAVGRSGGALHRAGAHSGDRRGAPAWPMRVSRCRGGPVGSPARPRASNPDGGGRGVQHTSGITRWRCRAACSG